MIETICLANQAIDRDAPPWSSLARLRLRCEQTCWRASSCARRRGRYLRHSTTAFARGGGSALHQAGAPSRLEYPSSKRQRDAEDSPILQGAGQRQEPTCSNGAAWRADSLAFERARALEAWRFALMIIPTRGPSPWALLCDSPRPEQRAAGVSAADDRSDGESLLVCKAADISSLATSREGPIS